MICFGLLAKKKKIPLYTLFLVPAKRLMPVYILLAVDAGEEFTFKTDVKVQP